MKIRKFKKSDAGRVCEIVKGDNKKITVQFYPKK
jgi:hypothetical protein